MTDLELINLATKEADSGAMTELVNRHTGIYMQTVASFPSLPLRDLKADRFFNIFDFARDYDPTRAMQFGSYVGDRTRYMCLNLLKREPKSIAFNEDVAPTNDTALSEAVDKHDDMTELRERAKRVGDPKFYQAFCLRFDGDKVASWRAVAKAMDMTQEGVRKLFNRHKHKLREYVRT
jgi:hypothetical protein